MMIFCLQGRRRLLAHWKAYRIVPVPEAVCVVLGVASHHGDKSKSENYPHEKKFSP